MFLSYPNYLSTVEPLYIDPCLVISEVKTGKEDFLKLLNTCFLRTNGLDPTYRSSYVFRCTISYYQELEKPES